MTLRSTFIQLKNKKTGVCIIFVALITVLALVARYYLIPLVTGDYQYCLLPWFEDLKNNGGITAIGRDIGDYTPMYLYILAILTYIPVHSVITIKTVSCIADILLAILSYKIVKEVTGNTTKGLVAYGFIMLMPSVLLNSAAWAQCDSIYSLFILWCIYFLLKDKDWAAAICFSIAFSFKLQSIFFVPVLIVLLFKKRIRLRTVLALPVVYFISIVPAWIAGRNLLELFTVYLRQAKEYKVLNMYIQNVWVLLRDVTVLELGKAGVFFAGGVVLISLFWICSVKFKVDKNIIITISGFYTLLLPFFLPFMHERYYYLATVICSLYAIINIKNLWMFIIMELCLFQGEICYLFGKEALDLTFGVILVFAVLLFYFKEIYNYINNPQNKSPDNLRVQADLTCNSK